MLSFAEYYSDYHDAAIRMMIDNSFINAKHEGDELCKQQWEQLGWELEANKHNVPYRVYEAFCEIPVRANWHEVGEVWNILIHEVEAEDGYVEML